MRRPRNTLVTPLKHLASNALNAPNKTNDYRQTHRRTDKLSDIVLLELLITAKHQSIQRSPLQEGINFFPVHEEIFGQKMTPF